MTGVYARSLTRKDVFEAIRSRRCLAASGYRIPMRFYLGDLIMGQTARFEEVAERALRVEVEAPVPIFCVEIIRNGHILARGGAGGKADIEFRDERTARLRFVDDFEKIFLAGVKPSTGSERACTGAHRCPSCPIASWALTARLPNSN